MQQEIQHCVHDSSNRLVELSEVIAEFGFNIRPFKYDYRSLYTHNEEALAHSLKETINIYKADLENGGLMSSSKNLWNFCKYAGLVPTTDVFEKIDDDDCIEIYDHTNTQIYRNAAFFRTTSYSLEELSCRTWFELFERDKYVNQKVMDYGKIIADQSLKFTVDMFVPSHEVREKDSTEKRVVQVSFKAMSPAHRGDELLSIVISKCHNKT